MESVDDLLVDLSASPNVLLPTTTTTASNSNHEVQRLVDTGLNLGGFLCEAGRYREAHLVFQAARDLAQHNTARQNNQLLRMELLSRMLHALASYCNFDQASNVFNELYSNGK